MSRTGKSIKKECRFVVALCYGSGGQEECLLLAMGFCGEGDEVFKNCAMVAKLCNTLRITILSTLNK